MASGEKYAPSAREKTLLDQVRNAKYSREELEALVALDGSTRDVQTRMPVKITRHYFEQAKNSRPMRVLIKASPKETADLDVAEDPGKGATRGFWRT